MWMKCVWCKNSNAGSDSIHVTLTSTVRVTSQFQYQIIFTFKYKKLKMVRKLHSIENTGQRKWHWTPDKINKQQMNTFVHRKVVEETTLTLLHLHDISLSLTLWVMSWLFLTGFWGADHFKWIALYPSPTPTPALEGLGSP